MSIRPLICALLSTSALLCPFLGAQTHKVDAPDKVTRAIGVYEWTGDLTKPTAARLIPVSLFINTHFEDAGVYLAQPVPFALQTGDVYSIERGGETIGTLDLDYARNVVTHRSSTDNNPIGAWYGYGRFLTPVQEAKLTRLRASKPPVVVASLDSDATDDKPQFVRRQPSTSSSPTPSKTPTKPGTATAPTPTPAPDDDPDRPTLRHRDPADTNAKGKKTTKELGYVTPPNTSLNEDPNRPTLHRGIPAEAVTTKQLTSTPPNLHQAVAVSDAANRDPHIFTREWATSTERAETLTALEALAQPRLAAYIAANQLTPMAIPKTQTAPAATPSSTSKPLAPKPSITPKPQLAAKRSTVSTSSHHPTHSRTKKALTPLPTPVKLTDEQVSGYTLSYGGLPTFIYTVQSPLANGGPVYLTLVVQRLPAGNLQVALASVTDAMHLDRTPWLRPIDAVDPDWSHRASLLFELRAQTGRQFALYRLITAEAEQTFVTGIIE